VNRPTTSCGHITNGEQHLKRQRQLVASLKRRHPGLETLKQALTMLANMERMQRNHIAERPHGLSADCRLEAVQ
jgi:hypothetical protein